MNWRMEVYGGARGFERRFGRTRSGAGPCRPNEGGYSWATPFLSACINEALRLIPSAPGGGQCTVLRGTGGRVLGSQYIYRSYCARRPVTICL
ncbi:hypothetical protein PLICRDRAFT_622690 [Plicaturopsis crispa FD-325 SS-3]|nr:hypothetical protein PLICRDRAFT_622690 [Plicaturopsis crispa FD-325 SS-3]